MESTRSAADDLDLGGAVKVCSVYPYGRNVLRAFAVQILRIDIEVAVLSVNDLIALVEQELEF